MSNLIGAISLTNKQGLYLGSVSLDNLDISSNNLLYSVDGQNIDGISISNGLEVISNTLKTIGNSDIQLTSNSVYVNDGQKTIQSAVNTITQADVIYVSSGSYNETLTLTDKYNMAITAPQVGNTICEILSGVIVDGTSELIRLSNIQIKGANSRFETVGRFMLSNVVFSGTALQTNTVEIGKNSTKYITFLNCEFDNYCIVNISNLLGSVVYFINCNFGGATISLNQALQTQVIFNNCSGFVSYPSNATKIGLNVLTTGSSQIDTVNVNLSTINGSAYPPASGVSISNQSNTRIPYETSTSNSLNSNSNLTFNDSTNTLSVPNLTVTNINGSTPATSKVSISNQSNTRIPYETSTSDSLNSNSNLTFNDSTNTLSVPKISVSTINGSTPATSNVSVNSQANYRIVTGTATTDLLHCNQTLTWDDVQLQLYNSGSQLYISKPNATSVLISDTSTTGTNNDILIGIGSKCGGSQGVTIGNSSGKTSNGNYNIVIGSSSYNSATSASASQGNLCIGGQCMRGAITTASQNTTIGVYNNLDSLTTGNYNSVLGSNSALKITTHNNNTICGANSMNVAGQAYNNCSILGANVNVLSGDNQVQLGDSATTVYTYATATRSDRRDKNCIKDCGLGLEFINNLTPRQYKFDYREDYKVITYDENKNVISEILPKDASKTRNREHCGLIAQEVKIVMDQMGVDFAGYQDSKYNGGSDVLHLNYLEFIAPMMKAIQELSQQNKQLEERIKLLENK